MQVTFNKDHDDPKDCQLIVALTGSKEYIQESLRRLHEECTKVYGKPIQGQHWSAEGSEHVITPIWKGEKY